MGLTISGILAKPTAPTQQLPSVPASDQRRPVRCPAFREGGLNTETPVPARAGTRRDTGTWCRLAIHPSDLLEGDGLARPVVGVEELEMPIGRSRGDQVGDDVECAGQLRVRACDKDHGFSRVVGVELGLD